MAAKKKKKNFVAYNQRMPNDIHKSAVELAAKKFTSLNGLVNEATRRMVENETLLQK